MESPSGEVARSSAVLIPPNYEHRIPRSDARVIILHLDPDSDLYESLLPRAQGTLHHFERSLFDLEGLLKVADGALSCDEAWALFGDTIQKASGLKPVVSSGKARELDPRIRKALDIIKQDEELPEDIPTARLARAADISEGRFRHLFKQELGLPVRRYILWLRIRQAIILLREGITLTSAAHAAGFFDSAHFSRTFKEMFGAPPSAIFGKDTNVDIRFCENEISRS